MEVDKIFNDLDSSKTQECEEAKQKLVESFTQHKEQWLVQNMIEYFFKTGSARVLEVLVKVQSPHDQYIFDRLAECLKTHTHRVQVLDLFGFIIKKHPTWLYKVEKHRLIKEIFKLLLAEKEIVPLMSALICIVTLLPIIPSLVPNFFNDLFEVFGHLATWNCQNPNHLPDDKLVHLQLGVQMLFHRLYGMYPCNFLAYLNVLIKKEKGAIFQHTIKPLLETVRLHPMLVTANVDSEVNNMRWKEMEPHDVVIECARLSLPGIHQESNSEDIHNLTPSYMYDTPGSIRTSITSAATTTSHYSRTSTIFSSDPLKELPYRQHHYQRAVGMPVARFDAINNSSTWSPYNAVNASGAIPLTPTPSAMITQMLSGVAGSSPPEAAVEATPETTPMKDIKDMKRNALTAGANPHAVRAIFASSQPSSPMRKENTHFHFPEMSANDMICSGGAGGGITTFVEQEINTRFTTVISAYDKKLQQIKQDRTHFEPIEPHVVTSIAGATSKQGYRSPYDSCSKCETPEIDAELAMTTLRFLNCTPPTPMPTPPVVEQITKICDECNETERSMCTAGGLHIPTNRSMQLLAKDLKRQRNRMASYCSNDRKTDYISGLAAACTADFNKRRSKSCSSICMINLDQDTSNNHVDNENTTHDMLLHKNERRLQKSSKMMSIASAATAPMCTNAETQTCDILPHNYENTLFDNLLESKNERKKHESNLLDPSQILEQYILYTIRPKDSFDGGHYAEEKYQLLCLLLQYERYRREIHAERNRRLMGRSRDKRSLEMERNRLREQQKSYAAENKELVQQIAKTMKATNERERACNEELITLKSKYQYEVEQNKCLRQANENLQTRLNKELSQRKDVNYELESMRGQIFNMTTELQHAQAQADIGLQCKQELARLEAEFIVMGEVQIKCRDRLAEVENFKARDEEFRMVHDGYKIELKDSKHSLDEKSSHLENAKHKIVELQAQIVNNEKVITEQKRLLKTVKDEYDEKFKSLNKKYDVQKTIVMQMEEKIMMSLNKPQAAIALNACSPDTDRTDVASSVDRNSPLSTSLASSESLSASLRSSELRNLQTLVETPLLPTEACVVPSTSTASINVVGAGASIIEGTRVPPYDMASSANTATAISTLATSMATAINIIPQSSMQSSMSANVPEESAVPTCSNDVQTTTSGSATSGHIHPHLHLQQQKQKQKQQQKR